VCVCVCVCVCVGVCVWVGGWGGGWGCECVGERVWVVECVARIACGYLSVYVCGTASNVQSPRT